MNREQAEKLSKDALDELAGELEGGHSERLTAYLTTMARFHRYSFGNVLLIARQCPEALHLLKLFLLALASLASEPAARENLH